MEDVVTKKDRRDAKRIDCLSPALHPTTSSVLWPPKAGNINLVG